MKKRLRLQLAFVTISLFLTITVTQLFKSAIANPFYIMELGAPPTVTIQSPANGAQVNSVLVNVTVTKSKGWVSHQKLVSVKFHLDGKLETIMAHHSVVIPSRTWWHGTIIPYNLAIPFQHSFDITDLADGNHTITVSVEYTGMYNTISDTYFSSPENIVVKTAHFTLDSKPPNVSLLSEEKAYTTSDFPLNFTVNEPISQLTYSLDGQKNVTIAENTTLTNLPYGEHNVTVHATDKVGNIGSSETINFTIAEPPEPEHFPTPVALAPALIASGTSVAVIGVGLLTYFVKSKKKRLQDP